MISEVEPKSYIFASSRPWHGDLYEALRAELSLNSELVTSPGQLDEAVSRMNPRYVFFMHWNHIVGNDVLSRTECVCFHMTDLPYGRGGSPLQNLILRGHTETKLSAFQMVEELDAGPVFDKRLLTLEGSAEEIYRRAGKVSFDMARWIILEEPKPVPQAGEVVSFTRRRPKQSVLPADLSAEQLYDFIRMLDANGYPRAFLDHGPLRLEFSEARIVDHQVQARVTFVARKVRERP